MNRFLILATVLLLLGMVLWLASRPDAASQQMPEIAGFVSDRVQTIEIAGGEASPIRFKRMGAGWQLLMNAGEWHDANGDAVSHLLNDLAAMKPIRVVTRNPEQHQRLKVGSKAIRVTLNDQHGVVLLEVLIGKQGSDLLSTYVRMAGQHEVLAVDRSLVWQVSRPLDGWQGREALPVEGVANSEASSE